jgi:hypothetical protein
LSPGLPFIIWENDNPKLLPLTQANGPMCSYP